MSDNRKKFSFENVNLKINEFSKVFENLNMQNLSQFLRANPEFINHRDNQTGSTFLIKAVQNGNYDIVQYLLEKTNSDPNVQNELGMTPLHLAVENGNHKIINLLLEQGANPNIQQKNGETPLHLAANKGDYKVIKLLCLFGANINLKNENEISVLEYAQEKGNQKCIEVIKDLKEKQKEKISQNSNYNNKYNLYSYQEELTSDVQTGFKTTKNSDSPINRIKENMNIPFYTPDFVYKDFNFQNFSSKNSKIPFNHKSYSSNTYNPPSRIPKQGVVHYSNLTFENNLIINPEENLENQYDRGISFYPEYNSVESKNYLEYDSNNHKNKNYFSDKNSQRESNSFFIQMNDFEQRLEKIKKDLLDNVALTYEKNDELNYENDSDNLKFKSCDNKIEGEQFKENEEKQEKNNVKPNENYFSLSKNNYKLDLNQSAVDNNENNHQAQEDSMTDFNNNINGDNMNTPYLNTYSSNSKYNSSYSNLAQKLTFNNIDKKANSKSENHTISVKSENENKPIHKQEPVNYLTFINNLDNPVNERYMNMPRKMKNESEQLAPTYNNADKSKLPFSMSLNQNNLSKDKNYFLNIDDLRAVTLKPLNTESENNDNHNLNRFDSQFSNPENNNNINFNENNENNVYDYYYNIPARKSNVSNNIFSLSNTKTNEYLLSDFELTNDIAKIKKLLSENFYDDGRVLTVFYSQKNDINENYIKTRIIEEGSPNVIKTKSLKNNLGDTVHTSKKIEELLHFNLQEFDEYLKSSVLKDKDDEDDEDPPSTKQTPKEETIPKIKEKNKKLSEIDLQQSTNSIYSQHVNKEKNYEISSKAAAHQHNNSVKYFSKTNRSVKDEYKHMSLDTYTIDEVSVTICPRSNNDTLDKINMITADIKQNGIDQIEFEYNSTEAMKEIDTFLKSLELERYTTIFIKHGFDDLKLIIEQMKSETSITDKNLKDIGINLPGHRAKILLKLEESKIYYVIYFYRIK